MKGSQIIVSPFEIDAPFEIDVNMRPVSRIVSNRAQSPFWAAVSFLGMLHRISSQSKLGERWRTEEWFSYNTNQAL